LKLLFDQNLSYKLVSELRAEFPDSLHVRNIGLASGDDIEIWKYARDNGFCIVSKDDDFHQRSFLYGAPPKVVWLRVGNCSTRRIVDLIRLRARELLDFDADPHAAFLALA